MVDANDVYLDGGFDLLVVFAVDAIAAGKGIPKTTACQINSTNY